MQDGTATHITRGMKQLLRYHFGTERIIIWQFNTAWPFKSTKPVLAPIDCVDTSSPLSIVNPIVNHVSIRPLREHRTILRIVRNILQFHSAFNS